jgi:hypothetical protein
MSWIQKIIGRPKVQNILLRCPKCGATKNWKRFTTQKTCRGYTLEWCPCCRWFRMYHIERVD